MSSFTGTQDKCNACGKTVHVVDLLTADGISYHKACFKCSHCKGTLVMSNYSSMDGVLYCKTHFEQLFKETGNFNKNFQPSGKSSSSEKLQEMARTPSKLSYLFSGTQDKCAVCNKTAYPLEKVSVEGESYHKSCFRCAIGGCALTPSSYAAMDGVLYCKHHFAQLFMEKGSYSHIKEVATKRNETSTPGQKSEMDDAEAQPQAEGEQDSTNSSEQT
ncbi:hypothetical protein Sjap_004863 [Stephania japonica]|uniref:LIM zinc-binding domain-containing protein n=1 Tax=Stephania japonica TaxID=461633 RepID=A0AAP0K5D4_9MAGN